MTYKPQPHEEPIMNIRIRPTVAIIVLTSTVLLSALTLVDTTTGQKSPVGSWIVDVMLDQPGPPPFRNLATNTSDGLVLNTAPELGTAKASGQPVRWLGSGFKWATWLEDIQQPVTFELFT
jgi:hypothetical protein